MSVLNTTLFRYACGFVSHQALVELLTQPEQLDTVFAEHFDLSDTLLELLYLPSVQWFNNIRLRNDLQQQLLASEISEVFKQYVPQLQALLLPRVYMAFPAEPSAPGTLNLADGEAIDDYLADAPQLRAKHATRVLPPWTELSRDDLLQHPSTMTFLDLPSQHYHLPAYMCLAGQDLLNEGTGGSLGSWCMGVFREQQAELQAVFSPAQLRCTFDMAVVLAACQRHGSSDIDANAMAQIADWLQIEPRMHTAFGGV